MRTPASIARHPIHPMLVPIPIGLWLFSLVADLIHAGGSTNPAWTTVAFYCMGGGIVGALAAAVPGLIDLLSLPPGPRRTAITHMTINLAVVVLYAINFWMRMSAPESPTLTKSMAEPTRRFSKLRFKKATATNARAGRWNIAVKSPCR